MTKRRVGDQHRDVDAPLRIAIFTEAYTPILNGVAVATRALVDGLREQGHSVHVFAPRHPGQPSAEKDVYRLPSFVSPNSRWFPLSLPLSRGAFEQIADRTPCYDIVHTQHPFLLGRTARALARLHQAPLVSTIHTQYEQYVHYWSPLPGPARWLVRRSLREFCSSCNAVVAVARGMATLLREYGVPESVPIEVIPNDLQEATKFLNAAPAGVRERLGLCGSDILLLSVARLAPEKNLVFLLESLAPLLQRDDQTIRLVFAGDGPLLPILERRATTLGVRTRVVFAGAVPHSEIASWFASADVFLLPSVTEVNPLTLREALAAGTPAVAVDSFSARDIIANGEDGRIVRYDSMALCAAVTELVDSPVARHRMRLQARANAQVREGGGAVGALRTLDLYQRLLESGETVHKA